MRPTRSCDVLWNVNSELPESAQHRFADWSASVSLANVRRLKTASGTLALQSLAADGEAVFLGWFRRSVCRNTR